MNEMIVSQDNGEYLDLKVISKSLTCSLVKGIQQIETGKGVRVRLCDHLK